MSVTSSMWTAVSGLLAHGEKMSVVGNNISNVNTVAFKSQRMDFEDFVYQDTSSANGFAQMGRGTSINAIMGDFSQGSQEQSNTVTDMSINGNGFFKVRNPNTMDETFYTRAGNFRFNKNGELVDPHGYILQGWEIEKSINAIASTQTVTSPTSKIKGSGVPKDIKLGTFTCQPQHTSSITILDRLSTIQGERTSDTTDPFFALLKDWNASDPENSPPLGTNAFTHQTTLTVYDEGGTKHNLTVYFDRISKDDVTDWDSSQDQWEYLVTMDPLEDNRTFGASPSSFSTTDASRGLLMAGTLTMSTSGILKDMTAFVPKNEATAGDVDLNDLGNWVPAPLSNNGVPMMVANFSGINNVSSPWAYGQSGTDLNMDAVPYLMELSFGINSSNKSWTTYPAGFTAANVGTQLANLGGMQNILSDGNTTVAVADTSTSQTKQDGYGFGYLQNVQVSTDGVVSVRYDNGVTLDLWQITLYDFINTQGLYREGSNLYSETRDSGSPTEGAAGTTGLGQVNSNSLEMSNVDLAKEFVYMISTQRGFQSNSKTITTVDTMLEQVINMKR